LDEILAQGQIDPRRAWLMGVLLALLFLTRLDTLPLCLLVCAAWAFKRPPFVVLARLAAPLAAAFGLYLLVGARLFGHPWPVSAFLKREWSQRLLLEDPLFVQHGRLAAELADALWPVFHQKRSFWLYLALGLAAPLLALFASTGRRWLRTWAPFALFAWMQFLGAVWLYHSGYAFQPWYYLVAPWLACLAVGAAAQGLASRWPRATRVGMAAAAAALVAFSFWTIEHWRAQNLGRPEPLHAAAHWVREHVAEGERVGSWNAGSIAFLSGRQVVPLDGLVNSWPFALEERHDLCAYWRRNDVRYVVDAFDTRDRFGFARQPLPCLAAAAPIWVGPSFQRDAAWRIEAYRLER